MNARRVAAALRDLADAIEAPEDPSAGKPPPKRRRIPRTTVVPSEPVSEIAQQRARAILRRHGVPLAEEKS